MRTTKTLSSLFLSRYSLKVNKNYIDSSFNRKNFNIYYLNKSSLKVYNKFLNSLYYLSVNNFGFIILDDNYKNLAPLYNYIYSEKNLMTYKNFFFVKKNYFTYYNWMFFYKSFIKKFNVSMLIIFDYYSYKYFYKYLLRVNLPIASLVPADCHSDFIDYPIFFYNFSIDKVFFLSLLSSMHFLAISYKSYILKKKYITLFYGFQKNHKLLK